MRKIALEEHFMAPGFSQYEKGVEQMMNADSYKGFCDLLPDFDDKRLAMMDKTGIELCVLSQTAPGLQIEKDRQVAIDKARQVNDFLAQQIQRHPKRYAGFAHLPMQDSKAAIAELERCVNELGFKGALINGHTNGVYLDDKVFTSFWHKVAELDVPVYLHPASSFDMPHMYQGHPVLLGATWSWTVETATHALRLVFSGLFDQLPGLKIILGHMGETLPFMLWRLDSRFQVATQGVSLKQLPSEYIKENFIITTSGVCDNAPLLCTIDALGEDNVLFSTDYPFESATIAADFIDAAPISEDTRAKICYKNAERLLKL